MISRVGDERVECVLSTIVISYRMQNPMFIPIARLRGVPEAISLIEKSDVNRDCHVLLLKDSQ